MNRATITGYVGKDPTIGTTHSGRRYASFSLASSERWKDKTTGEKKEATEWHNVVVWADGLVSIVERFVKKGTRLYIEGKIASRDYEDKNGVKRRITEIVLQGFEAHIELMGGSDGGTRAPAPDAPPAGYTPDDPRTGMSKSEPSNELDDDIPF